MTQEQADFYWLANNLNNATWTKIPANVRAILKIDSRLGCYKGMLVTQEHAVGGDAFVSYLNRDRKIS